MYIGVFIAPTDYSIHIGELAREIEARGLESLWVPEHTHIPISRRTPAHHRFPGAHGELPKAYSYMFDPFIALMCAAAVTRTLKIGTGICLLTQRDTIITAKEVATLDQLSDGRVLLGIGGGVNFRPIISHMISPKVYHQISPKCYQRYSAERTIQL